MRINIKLYNLKILDKYFNFWVFDELKLIVNMLLNVSYNILFLDVVWYVLIGIRWEKFVVLFIKF